MIILIYLLCYIFRLRRLADPDDEPLSYCTAYRVSGMDDTQGILVLGCNNFYFMDNFVLEDDMVVYLSEEQRLAKHAEDIRYKLIATRRPVYTESVKADTATSDSVASPTEVVFKVNGVKPKKKKPVNDVVSKYDMLMASYEDKFAKNKKDQEEEAEEAAAAAKADRALDLEERTLLLGQGGPDLNVQAPRAFGGAQAAVHGAALALPRQAD